MPNAPINEALLDIRVQLPEGVKLPNLLDFGERVKDRFTERSERVAVKTGIQLSKGGAPALIDPSAGPDGYIFKAPNENKVVQARLDGFTFNKLRPYEDWRSFVSEARTLWRYYRETAQPKSVIRIALRYINRIELPLPIGDFKEYVLTIPEVAPGLPQALAHFFMQLIIPNPEIMATATITETMEQPTDGRAFAIIFDIDVWKEQLYIGKEETMWKDFADLRKFKNEIFFGSITKLTRRLFYGKSSL